MKKLLVAAILALATGILLPAVSFADNRSPDTAVVLSAENPGASGQLAGNTGGAALYYKFAYAGTGQPVAIKVTASPGRNSTWGWFGFSVNGPMGSLGTGTVEQEDGSSTTYSFTLSGLTAGTYQINVFNFSPGIVVSFNLQTTGLAAGSASPGYSQVPSTGSRADHPAAIAQPTSTIGGVLPAKAGGSSQFLTVDYPGMYSTMSINMHYSPAAPFQNNSVGFNAYTADGDHILAGGEGGRDSSGVDVYAELTQEGPETLLVHLVNYEPNDINYTLQVNGSAGTVAPATGNSSPENAYLLTAQNAAMAGTLPAGPEGTFQYFLIDYSGAQREVKVGVTADDPGGSYGEDAVGIALYAGGDPAGSVLAHLNNRATQRIGFITIKQDDPQLFGVQIFNWTKGIPLRYNIYVTGL